ncbi:GNAT family N-acetyltransferase [Streptomyces sp. HU2014]|uniref:GNAT family N-acetyltransferase n=1 Tax=Streptomyces sp. HU2014 TaxID=2939414 RepID=UPI00200D4481|nr:GNAT family N-acetyltransferase [Streptomyces sp. HU2014]UQI48720.1 GNAT family N-acetyltransferase [Streptomyces sp. HU2014]
MTKGSGAEASPVIRPRHADDVPAAAEALITVHASDGYPLEGVDRPEEWVDPPGLIKAWVAEMSGRVVGHVAISHPQGEDAVELYRQRAHGAEEQVGVLARLFVLREARNRSVGERLTVAATTYARQRNIRLVLDVMLKDAAAIRLYERLGWQRLGTTRHEYGDAQQAEAVCFAAPSP